MTASHDFRRLARNPEIVTRVNRSRGFPSDQILLDFLAGVLLALEPARHPTATRPGLMRLRIAVLGFHLAFGTFSRRGTIATIKCVGARTTPLFRDGVAQGRELCHKLGSLGRAGFIMLVSYLTQHIRLSLEREIAEPLDHGTYCKLSRHFQNLSMLEKRRTLASFTRILN